MRRRFQQEGMGAKGQRAFVLLEAMLATAVFVLAVLSLARCVEAGLQAGVAQRDDARANRALMNCMRELQAGSLPYADNAQGTDLKGEFQGMRMKQSVLPLELVDQNNLKVEGMLSVVLTVTWMNGSVGASKELKFYAYPIGL
jgi:Tfp pilus assembly protein PilV